MRCYRYHRTHNRIDPAELARKKRLRHYHMVVAADPYKLAKHRAQSKEGMRKLRERRKAESTQKPDGAGIPSGLV